MVKPESDELPPIGFEAAEHAATNPVEAAFLRACDESYDMIYHYMQKVVDHHTAQDLTQETFTKAWASLGQFTDGNFEAWLMRIAVTVRRDNHKSAYNQRVVLDNDLALRKPHPETPDQVVLRQESMEIVQAYLTDQARPTHRDVILHTVILEEDHDTYGESVELKRGAVKVMLWRARQAIQATLGPFDQFYSGDH